MEEIYIRIGRCDQNLFIYPMVAGLLQMLVMLLDMDYVTPSMSVKVFSGLKFSLNIARYLRRFRLDEEGVRCQNIL